MSKKVYYSWEDIGHMLMSINNLMSADGWRPDYIVGVTRGGLVPAVMLSNLTGIEMHALGKDESNCWMAENAFGYESEYNGVSAEDALVPDVTAMDNRMNILIIDDINDSGKTFDWIKRDWPSVCLPHDDKWDTVWGENVRFATLVDNDSSTFGDVDYTAVEINKVDDPTWVVFPWEGERDYGSAD